MDHFSQPRRLATQVVELVTVGVTTNLITVPAAMGSGSVIDLLKLSLPAPLAFQVCILAPDGVSREMLPNSSLVESRVVRATCQSKPSRYSVFPPVTV